MADFTLGDISTITVTSPRPTITIAPPASRITVTTPNPTMTIVRPASTVALVPVRGDAAGQSAGAYTHTQGTASAVWTVQHGLGFNARPTVLSPAGDVVYGWTPTWPTVNVLVLTFPSPQAGSAYLS